MRSLLTVGGVVIGVTAIVFLVSLGFGLERLVTSQVANFSAFTLIDVPAANPPSGKINSTAIDRMKDVPHISIVERIVDLAGRVRLAEQNSTTETVVVGVSKNYFELASLNVSNGELFSDTTKEDIVVNEALAKLLGFDQDVKAIIGKTLSLDLIIPKSLRAGDSTDGPIVKEKLNVKVVGTIADTSNPSMYVPQGLTDSQGVVNSTSMKIRVDNKDNVATVRKQIENSGFATEYVGDTVDQITSVFSIFRLVLAGFGMIALVVAAIGTFNTLTISLIERIREVSLLKMMGMKRNDVFKLFIGESITIGIMGGVLGACGGLGIGWAANTFITRLAVQNHSDPVQIFYTPLNFIMYMVIGSIVVGFVTGLYPSYRAIKTNPLDALRYE
jgi:ABC-type antimicrobial peptide transport system permease subunit